jgi:CubicO group peptidase (beta-lactamase class C family)
MLIVYRIVQMKLIRKLLIIFIFLATQFLLVSCNKDNPPTFPENTSNEYTYTVPEQTGDGWETASLSDVGMDQSIITNLMNDLLSNDHFIHSIVIIRNRKLVFEEYFSGNDVELDEQIAGSGELKYTYRDFNRNSLHFQASGWKSFISALIGIGIDKGFIQGTNEKMFSFFQDYVDLNSNEKDKITIAHMLTMTSGLPWDDGSYPIYDSRNDEYQLLFNEDQIRFILEKPIVASPGTNFHYNSGTSFLLSEIVKRSSEKTLEDFAEEYLFAPLEITSIRWATSRNANSTIYVGGFYLRPRDMAKFGQLFLQEGLWGTNRIISEQWIMESTGESVHFSGEHPPMPNFIGGYGYQWWVGKFSDDTEVYCAAGWGGQFIMVLPDVDMIIVFTSGDYEENNFKIQFDIVDDFILPALI